MGLLKKRTAWDKAYRKVWRQEEKFLRRYEGKEATKLERKIGEIAPEALVETLHSAFCKAFEVVFEKGTGPILKAAGIEKRRIDYAKNACAADLKEDKKNLKAFSKAAGKAGAGNVLLSGAAGIGMGAFGVMLPDVPLFTAMLLKSVYETAESFGYRVGDNLFTFNKRKAAQQMLSALPYLETVHIRRQLPGTVRIEVSASEEKYCFVQPDGSTVITSPP